MRWNVTATELAETCAVADLLDRFSHLEQSTMEEPAAAPRSDSQHYRELATKLRDIARQCRFPGARQEVLDLASRYEVRANHLDARSLPDDFAQDPC